MYSQPNFWLQCEFDFGISSLGLKPSILHYVLLMFLIRVDVSLV